MKPLTAVFFLMGNLLWSFEAPGQTWDELFRQKETQKEYLLLQLGALKIQSGLLHEAGNIVKLGLNTLSTWKDLEKGLHQEYFASFRSLGPLSTASLERLTNSGNHPQVLDKRIRSSERYWLAQYRDPRVHRWSGQVHRGMLRQSDKFSAELQLILSMDLELEDGDRAKLIDRLARELQGLQSHLSRLQEAFQIRLAQQQFRNYELQLLNRH